MESLLHALSRVWEKLDSIPLITASISGCERIVVNGKDGSLLRAAVSSEQQITPLTAKHNYSDISQSACAFERRTLWRQRSGCEHVLLGCDSRDVWVLKSSVPVIHSRQTHWRKDGWWLTTIKFKSLMILMLDIEMVGQMLCSPRMPVLQ